MNSSIQIPSSAVEPAPHAAKGEVVKLVQGALLIAVAAFAVAGIASVAAPFCVWKGEIALLLNESFHTNCSVSAIAEYASAAPGSDWASLLVAALIAAYPAYHAVWRVREGLGLSCEAPLFNSRVLRLLAAVSAGRFHHDHAGLRSDVPVQVVSRQGPRTQFRQRLRYRACPPRRHPAKARELEPGVVLCGRAACLPASAGLHCRGLCRRERGHRARIRSCGPGGVPCRTSHYPCWLVARVAGRPCEFLSRREKNLQDSQVLFMR